MDDFYIKELLDKLEDNLHMINSLVDELLYTPDDEFAPTEEEKETAIEYLKQYYKKAIENESDLEQILKEAQDIYDSYRELIRKEKVAIEDTFKKLNIPLEEKLNESLDYHYIQSYNDYISSMIDNASDEAIDDSIRLFNRFAKALHTKADKLFVETVSDDNYEELDKIDAIKYDVEDSATEIPRTSATLHTFDDFAVVIEQLPYADIIWAKSEEDLDKFWKIATEKYNETNS